jgi:hypothetical protein
MHPTAFNYCESRRKEESKCKWKEESRKRKRKINKELKEFLFKSGGIRFKPGTPIPSIHIAAHHTSP